MSAKTLAVLSGRVQPSELERAPSAGRPRPEPCQLPRSGQAIVWLLQLAGQTSGPSWPAWLYAAVLYVSVSLPVLGVSYLSGVIGAAKVRSSGAFFTAAVETSLFGTTQVLTWLTMTCTFFIGRRRYRVLLTDLYQSMVECKGFATYLKCYGTLNRRFLIIVAGSIVSFLILQVNHFIKVDCDDYCSQLPGFACRLPWEMKSFILAVIEGLMFLIPLKLKFAGEIAICGIRIVRTEIQAMSKQDYTDPRKIRRLKKRQAKLSASFTQLTDGMSPELIACMFYGLIAQVTSFLLIVGAVQRDKGLQQTPSILLRLWGAVVTVVVPCEVGQRLLSQVSRIRDALLDLPPADVATNQEVLLHLEATRRDLDGLSDLHLFRLQRSTVLAATSAVVTYIIVFLQFQVSEDTG